MKNYKWIISILCAFAIVGCSKQATKTENTQTQAKISAASSVMHIESKADFSSKVLGADKVALVDFHATWCPPCRKLAPIIEKIANESNDEFIVVKIDIDKNKELAQDYQVSSIPTVIIFKNGKEVKRFVGLRDKEIYIQAIKAVK